MLETVHRDGFLIEHSADNFITNIPAAMELCRRLGIEDQLIRTRPEHRGAMIVHRGKLVPVPAGFTLLAPARLWPLLSTPLLSPLGKLRLLAEPIVRKRNAAGDESLASFARRRLGRETFERIVQPLVGGIYSADPEKLSLEATLPRFLEMERRHGSLICAARRDPSGAKASESGARYGLFATLRGGLQTLVDALVAKLPAGSLRLECPVARIARAADGSWQVHLRDTGEVISASGVIVTSGAPQAALMLRQLDAALARQLAVIESAGTSIVSLGYRRDQIRHRLNCFGFVVPAVERRRILAGSFSSVKFDGRAPDDGVLIRVFIGGALQSELAELPDQELTRIATEELGQLLGIAGTPRFADVARWPKSMPQYHVGHRQRVAAIEEAVAGHPGLALAGNAYHGVGIPHCIQSGEQAAERLLLRS